MKALARQFARTRAASAQRRHRYRSGPKASGTGFALQLRFRRLWDSNGRRGQRHKVGGKCGSPAVGCRFGFVASAALPVLLRLVAACQTAKQLREFWDCGDRPRNPFFLSVCIVFGCCSKRQSTRGAVFGETFSNGCSLARTVVRWPPLGERF